jgi:penicillin-binding protein 1A
VPTVRLASVIGSEEITNAARAAGIASDIPQDPAMALGAASVTPLELTAAYATFASLGDAVTPRMIRWVEGVGGDVLWQEGVHARQALDPAVAYVLTDILRDAVSYGTGTAVRAEGFRGPAAGKTGTTNDGRDAWFIGYTPDVVAGVWVGFDQPRPILRNASGGRLAAPVWGRMMRRVYDERPLPETWRAPETVTSRTIDPYTGSILADGCWPRWGEPGRELFIRSMLPEPVCPRDNIGRGLITSILSALGFGRDDDEDRDRRRGGSRGGPASAEQQRIEELLGAPMVRGMPRTAQAGTQPREERRSRDRRRGDARG